jgi:preprotein translocase subunit SecE
VRFCIWQFLSETLTMTNPAKFVREVRQEAARVTWPTRKETMISTAMVLVLTLISAIFFLVTDNLIAWGVQFILGLGA